MKKHKKDCGCINREFIEAIDTAKMCKQGLKLLDTLPKDDKVEDMRILCRKKLMDANIIILTHRMRNAMLRLAAVEIDMNVPDVLLKLVRSLEKEAHKDSRGNFQRKITIDTNIVISIGGARQGR